MLRNIFWGCQSCDVNFGQGKKKSGEKYIRVVDDQEIKFFMFFFLCFFLCEINGSVLSY